MTADDWFDQLPAEEQDRLDALAQNSILQLATYPRDYELVVQLLEWAKLENEILEAHGAWLSRTRALYEKRGWPWTTEELRRRSSTVWEHE
jgi:hypothetical protein